MYLLPVGIAGHGIDGIDPTDAELAGLNNLATVRAWVGVSAELWDAAAITLGGPTLLRDLIYIGPNEWQALIATIVVASADQVPVLTPITPVQSGRLGAIRRIARVRCGLTPGELPVGAHPGPPLPLGVPQPPGPAAQPPPYG